MSKLSIGKLKKLANDFKKDYITTDGFILRCDLCDVVISVDDKHQKTRITQHIEAPKHVKSRDLAKQKKKQPFIADVLGKAVVSGTSSNNFFLDLTATFIQTGIPLHKVNHPAMKSFLEKYTMKSVPDQSTLRKNYVKPVYDATVLRIKEAIGDRPVYFVLDETTDVMKRYVLNILVAPLTGEPVKPMLFKMYNLEKTNSSTVMQSFNDACSKLWPEAIKYDRVWMVLTDQAAYMLSAFSNLKQMYNNLKHVTCVVHCLHRVCESVRVKYSKANDFISEMKKVLLKSPARIQIYREVTGLHLPPVPVITRWGTWLRAAVFYCENFDNIQLFLSQLSESDSEVVRKVKKLADDNGLRDELYAAHSLKFLADNIRKLETRNLTKEEQWEILNEAREKLDGFARNKLESSLARNPDLLHVMEKSDLEFRVRTKFAPLVSVDVERSFSIYKNILAANRLNFTFPNVEMICISSYNGFLLVGEHNLDYSNIGYENSIMNVIDE